MVAPGDVHPDPESMVAVSLKHLAHWVELPFPLLRKSGAAQRSYHCNRPHANLNDHPTINNLVGGGYITRTIRIVPAHRPIWPYSPHVWLLACF